ncbi:MAG: GNAT family N-acetyltransferase, partial [Rhodanobacter sp.]
MSASTTIASAYFPEDAGVVRCLFEEYIDSLGIDLSFQDVAAELAG